MVGQDRDGAHNCVRQYALTIVCDSVLSQWCAALSASRLGIEHGAARTAKNDNFEGNIQLEDESKPKEAWTMTKMKRSKNSFVPMLAVIGKFDGC